MATIIEAKDRCINSADTEFCPMVCPILAADLLHKMGQNVFVEEEAADYYLEQEEAIVLEEDFLSYLHLCFHCTSIFNFYNCDEAGYFTF